MSFGSLFVIGSGIGIMIIGIVYKYVFLFLCTIFLLMNFINDQKNVFSNTSTRKCFIDLTNWRNNCYDYWNSWVLIIIVSDSYFYSNF